MNRQFRSLAWMCTLAMLLMVAVSVPVAGAQPRGSAVVLATQSDAARLDPAATGDVPSMLVQSVMFEGLVGWDKDQKLVPQLAESWALSDGGKVITWKLRHGVKFHDGEEFDAQAAKVNFDRWLDKANGLLTLSQFASVEGVEVVDKHTLKMTLKEPNGALLQTLAGRRAMFNSPKALAKWGKEINLHPTGTGPFEFVEWVPKDRIIVKRFEGYWGTKPSLEKITFKPVPEPASRVAMLEAGDADMAAPVPIQDVSRLRANPKLNVMMVDSLDNLHFALNMQKDIFKDARVRQAVNYAVDKEAIVKNIYNGLAVPLTKSPVSPFLWGYSAVGDYYKYDPAKAKELLKAAGVKPGTKLVMWIPTAGTSRIARSGRRSRAISAKSASTSRSPRWSGRHISAASGRSPTPSRRTTSPCSRGRSARRTPTGASAGPSSPRTGRPAPTTSPSTRATPSTTRWPPGARPRTAPSGWRRTRSRRSRSWRTPPGSSSSRPSSSAPRRRSCRTCT
jgi:ABC-type dipeptide transport system, periplasmic component